MLNIEQINQEIISNKIIDQFLKKLEKLQAEKAQLKGKEDEKTQRKIRAIKESEDQVLEQYQSYIKECNNNTQGVEQRVNSSSTRETQREVTEEELFCGFNTIQGSQIQISETEILTQLKVEDQIFAIPTSLYTLLMEHQKVSLNWLILQHLHNRGSILADEMGLGKTLSAISFLVCLKTSGKFGPTLVVCPATVINQWKDEIETWGENTFDDLKIYTTQTKTKGFLKGFKGIVITSYDQLRQDIHVFQPVNWFMTILDEAQKIKNCGTQVHQASLDIRAQNKLILSGTPIENSLSELWCLFNFVQPGLLGEKDYFEKEFCKQIIKGGYTKADQVEREMAKHMVQKLRSLLKQHILRRTKKQLREECKLPERNEFIVPCKMSPEQYNLYEAYLKDIDRIMRAKGNFQLSDKRVKNLFYTVISQLRKLCIHPYMFLNSYEAKNEIYAALENTAEFKMFRKIQKSNDPEQYFCLKQKCTENYKDSTKIAVLFDFLKKWKKEANDNKVLIFSQTKKALDILQSLANSKGYQNLRLDGEVPPLQRADLISNFNNSPEIFIFFLTTRVGGLGINLKSANKVVIFDPDWNPMVDIQATDRALRIGQKRDVSIYKLLVDDTVEEKIYHRQIFKKYMADKILQNPQQQQLFEQQTMQELLQLPQKSIYEEYEPSKKRQKVFKEQEITQKSKKFKEFQDRNLAQLESSNTQIQESRKDVESNFLANIFTQEAEESENLDEATVMELDKKIQGQNTALNYLQKLQKQGEKIRNSINLQIVKKFEPPKPPQLDSIEQIGDFIEKLYENEKTIKLEFQYIYTRVAKTQFVSLQKFKEALEKVAFQTINTQNSQIWTLL